jgi:hypothetical protein
MPRGRHRVKIAVRAPFVKAEWEWIGFYSGGTYGNLDTSVVHEIIPPIADNTVGIQSFTCHRIVGAVQIAHQANELAGNSLGITFGVEDAGADQTSDNPLPTTSTDVDAAHHTGIMFRWVGFPPFQNVLADTDENPWELPIDIKVKRIIHKRQRLVCVITASTTAKLRALVNVRCLVRESAGS